jgi:RimJ/RimL family protein N-acetyltransferase
LSISLVPASARDLNSLCPDLVRGLSLGFPDPAAGLSTLAEILAAFAKGREIPPWTAYWGCLDGCPVGLCGFKDAPDPSGSVEIAYFTFPSREGEGVATGMAAALVEIARSAGARQVLAHTLPEHNASAAVLTRIGFGLVGKADDPEDGAVWRWSLLLSPAQAKGPPVGNERRTRRGSRTA